MENDKISIIIPIYNSEKWLESCIKSVIGQSYQNLEIILIDDGSTDQSGIICDKYAKKDTRIQVIHKKNEGVSIARNIGIKQAKGKYIKFIDSDDWLEEHCCEKLICIMEKKNADLVICGFNIYKNNKLLRTPHLEEKKIEIKENIENFRYIRKIFASPCNKLYKKEFIRDIFEKSQLSGEDLIFNLDYLKNIHTIYTTPYCLYNVRLDNESSLNRKFREDRLDEILYTVDREIEFCSETYGKKADITFLYNSYIRAFHAFLLQSVKVSNKKKSKQIIKKYVNNKKIRKALPYIKMDRIDYKIFSFLVNNRLIELIHQYIKMKQLIMKSLGKR